MGIFILQHLKKQGPEDENEVKFYFSHMTLLTSAIVET